VTVTAPNTQTVGQPLTLTCNVTTVRGITSGLDIVWRSDNSIARTIQNPIPTVMDSSLVYTDTFTISPLRTEDDGRLYECRVVVHTSPAIIVNDTVRLNVIGMCFVVITSIYTLVTFTTPGSLSASETSIIGASKLCWINKDVRLLM